MDQQWNCSRIGQKEHCGNFPKCCDLKSEPSSRNLVQELWREGFLGCQRTFCDIEKILLILYIYYWINDNMQLIFNTCTVSSFSFDFCVNLSCCVKMLNIGLILFSTNNISDKTSIRVKKITVFQWYYKVYRELAQMEYTGVNWGNF